MNAPQKEHPFLKEFGDFVKFLQSLWGILAGISMFFPLSNVLLKAIPLGYIADDSPGALEFPSPAPVTALVTVATLFIILQTFHQHHDLSTTKQKIAMRRQAWISFGLGALSLLLDLAVNFGEYSAFYAPVGIWGASYWGFPSSHFLRDFPLSADPCLCLTWDGGIFW